MSNIWFFILLCPIVLMLSLIILKHVWYLGVCRTIDSKVKRSWGSVRSGSGLSPEGANFTRNLESILMTKYAPNIIMWCIERGFYKKITWSPVLCVFTNTLGSVHTYVRVNWCRNIIKTFQYSFRIFVCYAN